MPGCIPIAVALLALLAGCAATPVPAAPASPAPAASADSMIATGLGDLHQIYLDEPDIGTLSIAGLNGLRSIAPELDFRPNGTAIELIAHGRIVATMPRPDTGRIDDWASLTTALLNEGRRASSVLGAADNERVYDAIFTGFARELDQYSRYAGADAARANRVKRQGFGGIGVVVEADTHGARVVDVTAGAPAATAGIAVGDRIVLIEGRSVVGMTLQEIVDLLRGPIASTVQVAVRRGDTGPVRSFAVERTHIVANTVEFHRHDDIAVIRLTGFNKRTSERVREAVAQARREMGPALAGLVLDLRGNPGGLLDQAVEVADLFLDSGRIVSTRGRHPNSLQLFEAREGDIAKGVPLVVLIDGATASAAEIVAAALQDHNRAVLIGSTSFGKGTVQTVLRLPNNGELILTWARLHAPSGYTLHRIGVSPSICTASGDDPVSVVAATLDESHSPIRQTLLLRRSADSDDEMQRQSVKSLCPWRPRTNDGYDVDVAAALLHNAILYRRALVFSAPTVEG